MDSEPGVCVIPATCSETILSDYLYTVYGLAHANKAILPRDAGGPWGQRAGVTVGGSKFWSLVVSAYQTGRNNPSDWNRYSLVGASVDFSTIGLRSHANSRIRW